MLMERNRCNNGCLYNSVSALESSISYLLYHGKRQREPLSLFTVQGVRSAHAEKYLKVRMEKDKDVYFDYQSCREWKEQLASNTAPA
jgi:hypothetical protein